MGGLRTPRTKPASPADLSIAELVSVWCIPRKPTQVVICQPLGFNVDSMKLPEVHNKISHLAGMDGETMRLGMENAYAGF